MKDNRTGVIYVIFDVREPDKVRYVGLTSVSLNHRRGGHWTDSQRGELPIHRFLRKRNHDRGLVSFQVIDEAESMDELNDLEMGWIAYYRSIGQADLNITDGGGGTRGRKMTDEQKEEKRQSMLGRFRGENFKGELKLSWDKVRDIRRRAQTKWESQHDLADEFGVTQSIIARVLTNISWIDETFDPGTVKPRPAETHANNRQSPVEVVKEILELRKREWIPEREIGRRYGLTRSNVNNILRNHRWPDPEYNPKDLVTAGGNGNGSKLTEEDVIEIRRRVKSGELQRVVGESYGIGQVQVSRIVRGVRWCHVKEGLDQ